MSIPPVFWHEGMFIRPHHFQASDRYWADQVFLTSKFDVHHNWGLRGIEIDTEALRNYRFEVHRLAARMRDGTLVVAVRGSDQALDPLDLKSLESTLGPDQTIDIVLAVPTLATRPKQQRWAERSLRGRCCSSSNAGREQRAESQLCADSSAQRDAQNLDRRPDGLRDTAIGPADSLSPSIRTIEVAP